MTRPARMPSSPSPGCRQASKGARVVQLRHFRDGRSLDALEALQGMSPQHWAYAHRHELVYLGSASGFHVWELDEAQR